MNEKEAQIVALIRQDYPHVSAERLISGSGIPHLYRALCLIHQKPAEALIALEIANRGIAKTCPVCVDVLETFCAMLGTIAGNLALTLGAQGGVYLGGGITTHLGHYFEHSSFRARFEEKGRLQSFLAAIPTYVITAEYPALRGAATVLPNY
jgi:glucokinase